MLGLGHDLRSLINVADDGDFVLIVAWLLDALRNGGAHPVLVINGGEGTAKSTLVEILRALIDPSRTPLSGLPRTERQFDNAQGYLRPYDNVSHIPKQVSDSLCRTSAGSRGHPIILNGIEDPVMRPDLADRCLFVNLAPVSDRQRRSQQEIWITFEKMQPKILGALLDAVADGLRALPTTRLDELPRMADFALWVTACEVAVWPKGTFIAAYNNNRTEAATKLIETDVVATAVQTFLAKRRPWSGTATELDIALRVAARNLEGAKGWPAAPRNLADRLRGLASSLGKTGITVTFERAGHNRTRVITLSRREQRPDPPTTAAPPAASGDENPDLGNSAAEMACPNPGRKRSMPSMCPAVRTLRTMKSRTKASGSFARSSSGAARSLFASAIPGAARPRNTPVMVMVPIGSRSLEGWQETVAKPARKSSCPSAEPSRCRRRIHPTAERSHDDLLPDPRFPARSPPILANHRRRSGLPQRQLQKASSSFRPTCR
jgi:hypothetical protein